MVLKLTLLLRSQMIWHRQLFFFEPRFPMMLPQSPSGLYLSIRGVVACLEHVAGIPENQWIAEG
jgi:hypothetical protein